MKGVSKEGGGTEGGRAKLAVNSLWLHSTP